MKKVNVLRLLITSLLIVGCQTICGDLLKSARPMTQKERIESMSMSDVRHALITGKTDVNQAVKIINDYSYDHARGEHYYSSMNSYEKAKSIAYKMILLLEGQLNACEREYRAVRESLSGAEQAQLDIRYNAFKTKINELIHQQKIITGEVLSGFKKMLLGAAVVGVALLVGRYMTSMNQVVQEVTKEDTATARLQYQADAEKNRSEFMEKIKEIESQLEAQKELNSMRWAGHEMIERKQQERNREKAFENMEGQYKEEDIARQQQGLILAEQERNKQLRKQAWFDIAASYALMGVSSLLVPAFPLVGGSIRVPLLSLKPFGYVLNPAISIAGTAAVSGAMGIYRFIQSIPEDRPIPKIFEHINPH